jgi:hypothetical protein
VNSSQLEKRRRSARTDEARLDTEETEIGYEGKPLPSVERGSPLNQIKQNIIYNRETEPDPLPAIETGLAVERQSILSYYLYPMGDKASRFRGVATDNGLTVEQLREAIDNWKAANGELTARENTAGATAELWPENSAEESAEVPEAAAETTQRRLKWKPDFGLTAAEFAAQAYAAEFARGTFDKSIIRRDDKTLYQLLFREKAWGELAELTKSPVLTKSGRQRARKVEAVQAIGLPVEQAERVVATVEQGQRGSVNRSLLKARSG